MGRKLYLLSAALLCSVGLWAQGQQGNGERPAPPEMKKPAEIATEQADRMQAEVGLDKKQYRKVYKLIKKDYTYRQNAMKSSNGGPGMPPPGGGMGGPGMGGPGGGMGGGMMGGPGGGMGGPGGGMGGPGGGGDMQQGGRPEGAPDMKPGESPITEEYLEKQDRKLQKILTPDQYRKWRSRHPAEHLELPPMELKK